MARIVPIFSDNSSNPPLKYMRGVHDFGSGGIPIGKYNTTLVVDNTGYYKPTINVLPNGDFGGFPISMIRQQVLVPRAYIVESPVDDITNQLQRMTLNSSTMTGQSYAYPGNNNGSGGQGYRPGATRSVPLGVETHVPGATNTKFYDRNGREAVLQKDGTWLVYTYSNKGCSDGVRMASLPSGFSPR
jgi:hypothetical protein